MVGVRGKRTEMKAKCSLVVTTAPADEIAGKGQGATPLSVNRRGRDGSQAWGVGTQRG